MAKLADSLRSVRRRRRRLSWSFAALLGVPLVSTTVDAAPPKGPQGGRRFGLGGGIGDPLGPSLKLFLHPAHALQFDFGWAPLHFGHGIFHVNYLGHFPPFVSNSVMDFGMYLGVGTGMGFWGPYRRGYYNDWCEPGHPASRCRYYDRHYRRGAGAAWVVRAPVGVYFHFQQAPVDLVAEGGWSPYVLPWWPWQGDFSVKCRYYF